MISRRGFLTRISAVSASALAAPALQTGAEALSSCGPLLVNRTSVPGRAGIECSNSVLRISVLGDESNLWILTHLSSGQRYSFAPPQFPIKGGAVPAALQHVRSARAPKQFGNGVTEYSFTGQLAAKPGCELHLIFQLAPESSVVRFRYSLQSGDADDLTFDRKSGALEYLRVSLHQLNRVMEVQLSNWNALLHSDTLAEREVPESWFEDGLGVAGPILVASAEPADALLLAYEHGAQAPDTFLRFNLVPDRQVVLAGTKANYVSGQPMRSYDTIWMEAAVSSSGAAGVAAQFRKFVREAMDTNGGSRTPYLFYNTWNFQERDKWWYHKDYYSSYNNAKMLAELDKAHRLGLEIFVMDAGWFEKTGDWEPNSTRFPDGLGTVKAQLDKYGMKLGLWFNPTMAAVSSRILSAHRDDICTWMGKTAEPGDIWGSEASYPMCLVSSYSEAYADTLIRVARETGARYFIWDALAAYGCDSPDHWHGSRINSREERSDSYAFQLPLQMVRIVEKVRSVYPEIIFDFDITENGRAVGLSFLSAGRFFLANNGPYLADYDLPHKAGAQNDNIFFFPGPARTWICRAPLDYDRWIPSNLFLTHYFPDDPYASQLVNMATLVLGQNGIWGNLSMVSEEGIGWMSQVLGRYKTIRRDVMASDPIRTGCVASSDEVHEKINPANGKGVVVLFSTTPGKLVYTTRHAPARELWATEGTEVRFDRKGRAVIENQMEAGAAIVFFGMKESES